MFYLEIASWKCKHFAGVWEQIFFHFKERPKTQGRYFSDLRKCYNLLKHDI